MKYHAFTSIEIRCRNAQRNAQLFEALHFQCLIKEGHHAVVGSKSVARDRPSRKRRKPAGARHSLHFLNAQTATVKRADQRAHARPRNRANRNAFFFENFQDADVRHTAGKSATQGQPDCRHSRLRQSSLARKLPPKGLH